MNHYKYWLYVFVSQCLRSQIESKFSVCDKLEESIDFSLKKAFSGELTKEWRKNNSDLITGENSAENLLKKAKAEKEAQK